MADNLMTKVWALDFAAHRWGQEGTNEPASFSSATVKFVALAIARSSLHSGACWASQKTISVATGVSKQTVARAIGELEAAGWLRRIGRSRTDGGKSTDKIWLTLPQVILEAEFVPSRPQRFFLGGEDAEIHDGTPGTAMDQRPVSPRQDPPIKESGQEGLSERKKERSLESAKDKAPEDDIPAAAKLIWQKASKIGRQRSSVADIEAGLRAAIGRGHAMERILRGLGGYFDSPDAVKDDGAYQRGAHVMLAKDRWTTFVDDSAARAQAGEDVSPQAQAAATAMGTLEQPSEVRQRLWMKLWTEGMPWDAERGPQPARMGCRVSDAIQREFGAEPFAPTPSGDDAAFD